MIDERIIEEILAQPEFDGFHYEDIIGCGGFATVAKISIEADKVLGFKDYEVSTEDGAYALKIIDVNEGYEKYKSGRWNGTLSDYKKLKVNQEYKNIKVIPANSQNYEHIVPIIRHQQISLNGKHYLCLLMPFFPGSALNNLGRYNDEKYTVDFALQVSKGLSVMHKYGLIHRDLKPENILESLHDFKSIYKITDLGGIRQINENRKKGNTSVILFSGNYTAPECRSGIYSFQSDIYSLGMCIARFRFNGHDEDFDELVKGFYEDNFEFPDYYSEGLQKIIRKCIQYSSKNRYSSVLDMISELEQLRAALEVNSEEAKLQRNINDHKEQISNLNLELIQKEKRIQDLLNEIKQKEELMNVIVANENNNIKEKNSLTSELKDKEKRIQELENKLSVVKEENERNLNKVRKDNDFFRSTIQNLTKQIEMLTQKPKLKPLPANPEFNGIQVGDLYSKSLGKYNGNSIEWTILKKDETTQSVLLVSKDILFNEKLNNNWENVYWESSDLRTYLNNDFYNQCFTKEEKEKIKTTTIVNNDNSKYGTEGGRDTEDKVFLLSIEEVEECFGTNSTMISKCLDNNNIGSYWLRSPGINNYNFARVFNIGGIDQHGNYVDHEDGVRPAMWVRI